MSEFSEVVKQLGRICASNFGECDICNLRPFCPTRTFLDKYAKSGRAERLEEMVMKWAAEHPQPVFPTWGEWLNEQGVVIKIIDNGALIYEPDAKTQQPIPADIAQKLGIEPKEG